jgi:hypothetical protein
VGRSQQQLSRSTMYGLSSTFLTQLGERGLSTFHGRPLNLSSFSLLANDKDHVNHVFCGTSSLILECRRLYCSCWPCITVIPRAFSILSLSPRVSIPSSTQPSPLLFLSYQTEFLAVFWRRRMTIALPESGILSWYPFSFVYVRTPALKFRTIPYSVPSTSHYCSLCFTQPRIPDFHAPAWSSQMRGKCDDRIVRLWKHGDNICLLFGSAV